MRDEIKTDRLILRRFADKDLAALVDYAGDIDVARATARLPHPYNHADAVNWISISSDRSTSNHIYAIADIDDGLMGCVSLTVLGSDSGSDWELGYWLGQVHWHKGYMREAVTALLEFARPALAPVNIEASAFKDNPRSLALLTAFGFKRQKQASTFCLARGCTVAGKQLTLDLEEV